MAEGVKDRLRPGGSDCGVRARPADLSDDGEGILKGQERQSLSLIHI